MKCRHQILDHFPGTIMPILNKISAGELPVIRIRIVAMKSKLFEESLVRE